MSTLLVSESSIVLERVGEEITVTELKQWLDEGRDVQLIDVREPHEIAAGHLVGAKQIPLGQIAGRASEIDPGLVTVVYCKGGARSAKAIQQLRTGGFTGTLTNLKGGIVAWSKEVDPTIFRS